MLPLAQKTFLNLQNCVWFVCISQVQRVHGGVHRPQMAQPQKIGRASRKPFTNSLCLSSSRTMSVGRVCTWMQEIHWKCTIKSFGMPISRLHLSRKSPKRPNSRTSLNPKIHAIVNTQHTKSIQDMMHSASVANLMHMQDPSTVPSLQAGTEEKKKPAPPKFEKVDFPSAEKREVQPQKMRGNQMPKVYKGDPNLSRLLSALRGLRAQKSKKNQKDRLGQWQEDP